MYWGGAQLSGTSRELAAAGTAETGDEGPPWTGDDTGCQVAIAVAPWMPAAAAADADAAGAYAAAARRLISKC